MWAIYMVLHSVGAKLLDGILQLQSQLVFTDPEEPPVFEAPYIKEFQKRGLVCLCHDVKFTQDPLNYVHSTN